MKKPKNATIEVHGNWKSVFNPAFNYGEFATIPGQAGRPIVESRANERRYCPSVTNIHKDRDATVGHWLKIGSNSLEFEGITHSMKIGAA